MGTAAQHEQHGLSAHCAVGTTMNNLLGLKRATMTAVNIINFKHGGNTNAAREVTMA